MKDSEAGNVAVKVLATGRAYLAGGASTHSLEVIKKPDFIPHFKHKGRFASILERIPVHVVVSPAGLAGAAVHGFELETRTDENTLEAAVVMMCKVQGLPMLLADVLTNYLKTKYFSLVHDGNAFSRLPPAPYRYDQ